MIRHILFTALSIVLLLLIFPFFPTLYTNYDIRFIFQKQSRSKSLNNTNATLSELCTQTVWHFSVTSHRLTNTSHVHDEYLVREEFHLPMLCYSFHHQISKVIFVTCLLQKNYHLKNNTSI